MLNCHFEVQLEMSPVQLVLLNNLVYDAEVSAAASCPRGRRVTVVEPPSSHVQVGCAKALIVSKPYTVIIKVA